MERRELKKDGGWRIEEFEVSALSRAVIGIRAVCRACWMTSYKMEVDGCYSTVDIEAAQWFWSWCIMS